MRATYHEATQHYLLYFQTRVSLEHTASTAMSMETTDKDAPDLQQDVTECSLQKIIFLSPSEKDGFSNVENGQKDQATEIQKKDYSRCSKQKNYSWKSIRKQVM